MGLSLHNLMSSISFTGVVGGIAVVALTLALIWFCLLRKKPTDGGKARLERGQPQGEESLLSPASLSPPIITRVGSTKA